MATDATVLAIGADTSAIPPAVTDLDRLTQASKRTEDQTDKTTAAFEKQGVKVGVAIAATIAIVTQQIASFIDYADKLDEFGEKLGLRASEIGALGYAASQSDTSLENLVARLGILADRASDAAAGSARANAGFKAMGIAVTDANGALKNQETLLLEIAEKFSTYRDGTAKAALAQELFGRGGRDLIPLLNKGKEGIEELKKKYLEMAGDIDVAAAKSSDFNDMLASLQLQVKLLFGQMAGPLMDALMSIAKAFRQGSSEADAFRVIGEAVAAVFKVIASGAVVVVNVLHQMGENIGALAAAFMAIMRGDFSQAWTIMKENAKDSIGAVVQTVDQLKTIWTEPAAAAKKGAEGIEAPVAVAAKKIKEHKDKISADLRELIGDYGWFVDTLTQSLSTNSKYEESLKRLDKVAKAFGLSSAEVAAVQKHLKETLDETTKAAVEEEKRIASLLAELDQLAADRLRASDEELKALIQQRDALIQEGQAIGLTKAELDALTLARLDEKIAILEQRAATGDLTDGLYAQLEVLKQIRAQIAANQAARAAADSAKQYQDSWVSAFQSINSAAEQTFADMLHGSRDFAQRFKDSVLNMLYSALYQLTVKPFVVNIVASMSGVSAGALGGGQGGAGNLLNLLGGGGGGGTGSIADLFTGGAGSSLSTLFSGMAGSFATSGVGSALGLSSAVYELTGASSMALTGAGAGLVGLMGTIGTVMPYIGVALAIASALGAFDHGGPKQGGFASTAGLNLGSAFAGDNNRYFTPNDADPALQEVVNKTKTTFDDLFKSLGGQGSGNFGFAVGYDTDPEGKANNRAHVGAFINGQQVYDYQSGDDSLGRDPEALQQAIEIETKRAMLAGLQNSDLPESIKTILNSVVAATATAEDIDNITKFALAFKGLTDFLANSDPVTDAQKAYEDAQRSSIQVLADSATTLRNMAGDFDGTADSLNSLSSATASYYSNLVKTLAYIKQLREGISGMLNDTATDLRLSTMNDEQQRQYYQQHAALLREQLQTASSPEEVQRIIEQINDDIRKAWGLLTPEQQSAALEEQLRLLQEVQSEADSRLADIATTLEDAGKQTLDDMKALLSDFVDQLKAGNAVVVSAANTSQDAANTQLQAANTNLRAANTPVKVEVMIDNPVANG